MALYLQLRSHQSKWLVSITNELTSPAFDLNPACLVFNYSCKAQARNNFRFKSKNPIFFSLALHAETKDQDLKEEK